jgi:hypothetical protein
VVMANIDGVGTVDADVIVSLCRVGRRLPAAAAQVAVSLIDDDPAANPNLDYVLTDLVDAICRGGATVNASPSTTCRPNGAHRPLSLPPPDCWPQWSPRRNRVLKGE